MWFTIGLLAALVGLLYVYLVWNYSYWAKRGVPGPGATLIAGSFPRSFMQKIHQVYEVDAVYKKYRGTTPYFGYYASRRPTLMLIDPQYIKAMFTTDFKHFHDNWMGVTVSKESDPLLGRNPFILQGDEWKDKRSEITPAFTNMKLKTMYPIMQAVGGKLTNYIRSEFTDRKHKDGVNGKELAGKYTTDVVTNCIYGIDSLAFSGQRSIIREMSAQLLNFTPMLAAYFKLVQFMPWIERFYVISFVPKHVERFFEKLTCDALRLRKESGVKRDDFLNYLITLQKRKPVTDLELTAHTMTFFTDGSETSSIALTNVLLQLGENPDVQARLRREIRTTIGDDAEACVSFEQLNEMPYLDQVMHESLRHMPLGGLFTRQCTEAFEMRDYQNRPFTVERGTLVQVPSFSINADAEYYPNPERFDPDRFDEANGGVKRYYDQGVFFGFGVGPRICLGMRFALLQNKSATVEIVRRFAVSVNKRTMSPIEFDPGNFLLEPKGGIWLDFESLENLGEN